MRKVLFAVIAMFCCTTLMAQEEADTIIVKKSRYYLNETKTFYTMPGLFSLGWNFTLNGPEYMDKSNGCSMYFMWDVVNFGYDFDKHNSLVTGVGMVWSKYASSDNGMFAKNEDAGEIIYGKPLNFKANYTRYLTYSLTLPILYQYTASNKMFVSAGPVLNFNVYGSIFNEYCVNNEVQKVTTKGVYQSPVTVDFRLTFGYKNYGVMLRYAPMNVIQSDKGPGFQYFSVGVSHKF